MPAKMSERRIIRFSHAWFNPELALVGLVSAGLVLLINWWGTDYFAWHAALVRLALGVAFNAFMPKIAENVARLVRTPLGRQFFANIVPNTLINFLQYPIFVSLGVPRPFWSVFPFWLISVITFTQIVKHSHKGYEPGVLDIAHGLWEDMTSVFRR